MNILRRRSKMAITLLPISALAFLLLISHNTFVFHKTSKTSHLHLHLHKHIQAAHSACEGTLYPELCVSTLSSFPDLTSKSLPQIIAATLNQTVKQVRSSNSHCNAIKKSRANLAMLEKRALDDCIGLFDGSLSEIYTCISDLSPKSSPAKKYEELETLLSGAMTNQVTCLDGFSNTKGDVRNSIQDGLHSISRSISNSLAMLQKVKGSENEERRKEVFSGYGRLRGGFPAWVSRKDRRLLQTASTPTNYDLVVAKDGSGNFTTIGAAVDAAPNSSTTRFVIYIKAGAYFENVEVVRKKTMLMFLGDGIGRTVVKASRNVVDGWTTFQSATVAVVGDNFIAKGITFENSAGPSKHQAVALRSGSDLSAFYKCSFVGYQDTLYVHSLRQFYRECDIYGTIDFIFGNAAVVFQNCNLYARKPNANQKNIFTAQGREDPNQNTGISILNCKVAAASDLIPVKSSFKTYLGRPWKQYSRTVYLQSYLDDLIDPAGWLEWNGTFALSTLYYGEYMNKGPGSNTTARVKWPGYRVINSSTEAAMFTVGPFIQGDEWLAATGLPYYLGLS